MHTKELIVIVGPTASGKTALAIELAKKYKTEIISADSRQFYKEMNIGTAKPSSQEQDNIKHHMINSHSIKEIVSAGRFEKEVMFILSELFKIYDKVICVGGSGLFIDALCNGLDNIPKDISLRKALIEEVKNNGLEPLLEELKIKDSDFYNKIDKKNTQRVIRAIEIIRTSGKKYSELRKSKRKKRPFFVSKIGINYPREILYNRINKRVDLMIENGLIDEVKKLLPYKNHNALKTVGYKEVFLFLENKINKEEAIELIKRNTRRYAKRQLTWFRKDKSIKWIDCHSL